MIQALLILMDLKMQYRKVRFFVLINYNSDRCKATSVRAVPALGTQGPLEIWWKHTHQNGHRISVSTWTSYSPQVTKLSLRLYLGHSILEICNLIGRGEGNGLMWFIRVLGNHGHWSSANKDAHVQSQFEGDVSIFLPYLHLETQSKLKWHQSISSDLLLNFLFWILKLRGTEYEIEAPGMLEVNSLAGDLPVFHASYPL